MYTVGTHKQPSSIITAKQRLYYGKGMT